MDINEIKEYCENMIARSERTMLATQRTASYYDDQAVLRTLWLQAEQCELLKRLAVAVEMLEGK